MAPRLVLASGSAIRRQMLENAGVPFEVSVPRIDEESMKAAMISDGAPPRDIADALAEMKARRVAQRDPGATVIGCDQVLAFGDTVLSKPATVDEAREQLRMLRGHRHQLLSAAVVYDDGEPVWRHVGQVRLQMRPFSDDYLEDYLARNWESVRHSVGAYKLEEEGVRLFSKVEGDYFTVLGMPLIELLSYLTLRGTLAA